MTIRQSYYRLAYRLQLRHGNIVTIIVVLLMAAALILVPLAMARAQTTTPTVTVTTVTVNLPGPCHTVEGLPGTTHKLSIVETAESVLGNEGPIGQWSKPALESLCDQLSTPAVQ